jgi:hypothetical protein
MEAPEPATDVAGQARARAAMRAHAKSLRALIYPADEPDESEEPANG